MELHRRQLGTRNGENYHLSLLEPPLDVFFCRKTHYKNTLLVCQKTPIYMQVSGFMREKIVQTSMLKYLVSERVKLTL